MIVRQGDVYWVQLPSRMDEAPRIRHPYVVIQPDTLSDATVMTVCALTTNLRKISMPGNVLLLPGEANLPRQSCVEVSKVLTIRTPQLGPYIGTLSEHRVAQILAGIRLVHNSFFSD